MKQLKSLLPDYPRTLHLPYRPNAVLGDLLASEDEVKSIFAPTDGLYIHVEEKVDGANCGMALINGEAVIRNRNHVLRKGYVKDIAAKKQFASAWNWFYENKKKFEALEGYTVYGEWMLALHGIRYDKLPAYFIAYDLYDQAEGQYVATPKARMLLEEAGFFTVPLLHTGPLDCWEQLVSLCNEPSAYSSFDKREGVYLKISNDLFVTARYKMVRGDYVQGCRWDEKVITKNQLYKQ
jgi:atypical dual specificity phosphatase